MDNFRKTGGILIKICSYALWFVILIPLYIINWALGGPLTTVESCSGSYISGKQEIEYIKKSCPNLTKENLEKSINEHFDKFGNENAFTTREAMLREVRSKF